METIGMMRMPADFKYREVFLKGKPEHVRPDSFLDRHPPMPASQWAKIFSPFDALKGFDEAVASKEVQYVGRIEPGEEKQCELNRKLCILQRLARNGRAARENRTVVTVKYFVPCRDREHFAYGSKGLYLETSGTVLRLDTECGRTLRLQTGNGEADIPLDDILEISGSAELFEPEWEKQARTGSA